ncbi:MAG: ADP-glyceromanno-heptose 6-epimerase [Phycisphaerales bacterium]|nr:ADP-glyceromanno-heptose 6-epimerase [Phycisphaerales bacterium]
MTEAKRILVTGGAGFIGSNLALALQRQGHEVMVLDNFSSGDFRNLRAFRGDVVTGDCFAQPAGKFQVIFHQASITDTTVTDQHKMMTNNVEAFRQVLGWAAEWKARVVWASSAAVYGNLPAPSSVDGETKPLNVYGYSKLAMEHLAKSWAKATNLPIVGLRYFNVFGPGEAHKGKFASMIYQLAQQMKAGKRPRIFRQGEQRRDFVWIGDVIAANMAAMAYDGKGLVFNVGSGRSETFNTVVKVLNEVLGTDLPPEYIDNPYDFFQNHTEASIGPTTSELGYRPQASLLDAVKEYKQSEAL